MSSPVTWVTRHLQSMFAALGRLLRRPLSTLLTTLVIAVALALPAGLWLVVKNARAATGDLATAVQVTAYMKVGTPIARADQLCKLRRARDIRALADHQEALVGSVVVGLRTGKPQGVRDGAHGDEMDVEPPRRQGRQV